MITTIRNWFHRHAIAQATETRDDVAQAALVARINGDHAAARYFDAELRLAKAKLDALLGHPNPGRYCCDHRCEQQGRRNCACDSLPNPPRKVNP